MVLKHSDDSISAAISSFNFCSWGAMRTFVAFSALLCAAGCGASAADLSLNVTWSFLSGDCASNAVQTVRVSWGLSGQTPQDLAFDCAAGRGRLGEIAAMGVRFPVGSQEVQSSLGERVTNPGAGDPPKPFDAVRGVTCGSQGGGVEASRCSSWVHRGAVFATSEGTPRLNAGRAFRRPLLSHRRPCLRLQRSSSADAGPARPRGMRRGRAGADCPGSRWRPRCDRGRTQGPRRAPWSGASARQGHLARERDRDHGIRRSSRPAIGRSCWSRSRPRRSIASRSPRASRRRPLSASSSNAGRTAGHTPWFIGCGWRTTCGARATWSRSRWSAREVDLVDGGVADPQFLADGPVRCPHLAP